MTNLQYRRKKVMYRVFAGLFLYSLLVVQGVNAAPNILLIVSDDLNTDMSVYGNTQVKTPNLDALAKNGVRFDRTYAQYPLCTQSRSSFLTGLYPDQTLVYTLKTDFRQTIPRVKTLPQLFKENGYHTARVGKIFHYNVPKGIGTDGLDDPFAWNEKVNPIGIDRTRYQETQYIHAKYKGGIYGGVLSWMNVGGRDSDHTDGIATDAAVDLLEKNHPDKTGKPFFLAVGYYRPHVPFAAPEKYFDLYPLDDIEVHEPDASDTDDIPVVALSNKPYEDAIDLETRKKLYQAYYASVSYIDNEVGRLLTSLDELGLKEETIVVFISDHGFMLGEHGLWQKSNLFERSLQVPMIVSVPGNGANGKSTQSLTELVDLYPTLLDYAGIDAPVYLSGRSLKPVIANPELEVRGSALAQVLSEAWRTREEWRGREVMGYTIRSNRYRYTEWDSGRHGIELYDYRVDPNETVNYAGSAEYREIQQKLSGELRRRKLDAAKAPVFP